MFKKHITRFFSIIFIILISVGFTAGIGSTGDKINASLDDYYKKANVSDLIIKSSADDGFSEEDISALKERYGGENVNTGMSVDVNITVDGEEELVRLYFYDDYSSPAVNVPEILETGEETDENAVYVSCEEADNTIKGFSIGQKITLDFADILTQLAEQDGEELSDDNITLLKNLDEVELTVSSVRRNPLLIGKDGEPSYTNPADTPVPETTSDIEKLIRIDNVLYIPSSVIPTYSDIMAFLPDTPVLSTGDIYVAFSDRSVFNGFSSDYRAYVDKETEKIISLLSGDEDELNFITLYDNYSFYSLHAYAEKVTGISVVFMIAFLLITALVIFSNITRLIDEERGQIACLETQGYSAAGVLSRYALFSVFATAIGCVGAYFVGVGLCALIYYVFNYSFVMPAMAVGHSATFYVITVIAMGATAVFTSLFAGAKIIARAPAELLRPKSPPSGKKVILEKIPFIWNRLSFKYKSTLRNVLRYKSRFFMTVAAVAGAMGLVLAGLALLDMCLFQDFGSAAIIGLALLIVIFAGLLTEVVVYTLTNINISERNREIATLMVLGYYDGEVSGYIYREIYINTVVGIILGYGVGVALMAIIFSVMGFGSIGAVNWFVWLIAPFVVLLFTMLITLMLRRKITSIDMNESLKAVE